MGSRGVLKVISGHGSSQPCRKFACDAVSTKNCPGGTTSILRVSAWMLPSRCMSASRKTAPFVELATATPQVFPHCTSAKPGRSRPSRAVHAPPPVDRGPPRVSALRPPTAFVFYLTGCLAVGHDCHDRSPIFRPDSLARVHLLGPIVRRCWLCGTRRGQTRQRLPQPWLQSLRSRQALRHRVTSFGLLFEFRETGSVGVVNSRMNVRELPCAPNAPALPLSRP